MAIKITKNKSSLPVKIKKVHITGLDGFDENDLIVAFKTAGVSDVSDFRSLFNKGWEFHFPDEHFFSATANKRFDDLQNKEWEDETGKFEKDLYFPGGVLGYKNVLGMAEYYVFKRGGKYYTLCANKFEYSEWFMGGDFEVLSGIHKFNDLTSAMKFIIQDAPKLTKSTMTGHISGGKNNDMKQLKEAEISIYDADDIFDKYGVKGASLMTPDQLKAAYKKLAVKYHPDRGGDTRIMQDINAAYDSIKGGGGGTGSDDYSNTRSTSRRQQTSQRPQNRYAERELSNLGDYLKTKFDKSNYKFEGRIDFSLFDIGVILLGVTIQTDKWVMQIHISSPSNGLFRLIHLNNPAKNFNCSDKEKIFKHIDTLIQNKLSKKKK